MCSSLSPRMRFSIAAMEKTDPQVHYVRDRKVLSHHLLNRVNRGQTAFYPVSGEECPGSSCSPLRALKIGHQSVELENVVCPLPNVVSRWETLKFSAREAANGTEQLLDRASQECQLQPFLQKLARYLAGLGGSLRIRPNDMPGIYIDCRVIESVVSPCEHFQRDFVFRL